MKYSLITGGASGIGFEMASLLAKENHNLVITSTNEEKLNNAVSKLKEINNNIDIKSYVINLIDNDAANKLYDLINNDNLEINVLINNAGFGDYALFVDSDIKKQNEMIDLNIKTLINLTYLFLNKMKERNEGYIINVGSIASVLPGPYMSIYYASKAFVLSFSEALYMEMKPYNIYIGCICPGPTSTNFANRANVGNEKMFAKNHASSPSRIAKDAIKMMKKKKPIKFSGRWMGISSFFSSRLSHRFKRNISYKVNKPTKKG